MRRNAFDPTPELGELRDSTGVTSVVNAFGTQVYLITRHEDVKAMLSDHEHFANARPPGFVMPGAPDLGEEAQANARAGNLLGLDPPEHQRLRRMLTPEFTIRRIKRLEPRIIEIVDEHLDAMEASGAPADLVESFALPIPSLVICARSQPGEDILGMLIREHGDALTDAELVGIAGLLLLAGHETTSNMLGLGTLALLRHPDQLAAMRDDPDAVGPAIEELLRWLSIVQTSIPRFTTADVEIAGVPIPAGHLVFASLPSGNRDPQFTDAPDALDIRRGAPGHLAFGHGVHHCLGASLARMEMRIAWPALLRRFPTLALAEDFDDVAFRSFHFIYGLKSLAVRW